MFPQDHKSDMLSKVASGLQIVPMFYNAAAVNLTPTPVGLGWGGGGVGGGWGGGGCILDCLPISRRNRALFPQERYADNCTALCFAKNDGARVLPGLSTTGVLAWSEHFLRLPPTIAILLSFFVWQSKTARSRLNPHVLPSWLIYHRRYHTSVSFSLVQGASSCQSST